jgi:hypothetical protein
MRPPNIRVNIRELRVSGMSPRAVGRFQREFAQALRARLAPSGAPAQSAAHAVSGTAQQAAQRIATAVNTRTGRP